MGRKREAMVRSYMVLNETIHGKKEVGILFDDDGNKARRQASEVNANSTSLHLGFAKVEPHEFGEGLVLSGKNVPEQHVTEGHPSWPHLSQKYAPLLEEIERQRRAGEEDDGH